MSLQKKRLRAAAAALALALALCCLLALPAGAAQTEECAYGAQLTGSAAERYAEMAAYYTAGGTGDFTCTISYSEAAYAALPRDVKSAFAALNYDFPEIFWFGNYGLSSRYSTDWRTIQYTVTPNCICEGADSAASLAAFRRGVDDARADIDARTAGSSARSALLRAIHDYLCERLTYPSGDLSDPRYYSAAPAFTGEAYGVCECYSRAFKLLCDAYDVPCVLVSGIANGGNHMWNEVRLETGRWYLVDVTFDDQTWGIQYDYFLAGSGSAGFQKTISAERRAVTPISDGLFAFAYPALSETSYAEDLAAGVQPEPEPEPAPAAAPICVLSPQKLAVDGVPVPVQIYNIDGFNYFKLRDIAALLTETGSRFDVGYDEDTRAILLSPGAAYTPVQGDLKVGEDQSGTVTESTQIVQMDGSPVSGLGAYNIGGYSFFKLRDLADLLGFAVDYDEPTNTAIILSAA